MQVWELEPGRLMVAGGFSDLALHHHPAVQITLGGRGPLSVTSDGETHDAARLVVIASAGFDPVRDDGEAYAEKLRAGGIPVALTRQVDLPHGYLNFVGLGGRFAEAASEAAGALRLGLALGSGLPTQRRAGELVGIGDIP